MAASLAQDCEIEVLLFQFFKVIFLLFDIFTYDEFSTFAKRETS